MNIYDFDKTIYDGDSTAAFIKYCTKKYKKTLITLLPTAWAVFLYIIGIYTKTQFKEKMYRFLMYIPDIDEALNDFWDKHEKNILDYYIVQKCEDDIIISASPDFLLEPICKRLGIKKLIASRVDKHTGKYTGKNCWGKEKVGRLWEKYEINHCDKFFSDSYSDTPLAGIADNAFIVRQNVLTPWDEYKKTKPEKLKSLLLSQEFLMFCFVGFTCTIFNVGFSAIFNLFITDTTLAFFPGYLTANIASFILNSTLTFKERLRFLKYIKYFISYIPNFAIQTIVVFIFTKLFPSAPGIIAYAVSAVIGLPVTFIIMKIFTFANKSRRS